MDKQMKLWQVILTNLLTGIILCVITYALTRNGAKIDKNDETIKQLAKTVYVDERDKELKTEIDKKLDKDVFLTYLKAQENYQAAIMNDLGDIKKCLYKLKQ